MMPDTTLPADTPRTPATDSSVARITSANLLQKQREIEIDHEGRIYRLRLTNSNKLILTA